MRNRWTTGLLSGLLTVAVLPVSPVSAVSGEVIGYGQGTAVDSENRPVDAVAFDAQYARYDAYATTPDRSQILLTFDQGYENGYTGQILDTLREKQVHAVFFLTGDYAKKETDLVNRMIAEGHVLGNHGMTHASLPTLSEAEAKAEIMDLHQYVLDKYGYEMQYFRCPCGEYSEAALETAQACGYRTRGVFYQRRDSGRPDRCSPCRGIYTVMETTRRFVGLFLSQLPNVVHFHRCGAISQCGICLKRQNFKIHRKPIDTIGEL